MTLVQKPTFHLHLLNNKSINHLRGETNFCGRISNKKRETTWNCSLNTIFKFRVKATYNGVYLTRNLTNYSSHVRIIYKIHNFLEHLWKWCDVFFTSIFYYHRECFCDRMNSSLSCVRQKPLSIKRMKRGKSGRNGFSVSVCLPYPLTSCVKGVFNGVADVRKHLRIETLSHCFVFSNDVWLTLFLLISIR